MITEVMMSEGSWEIQLQAVPDSMWNTLESFGHIVITSQYIDPALFGDSSMLAAARYVGPLLAKSRDEGVISATGVGMVWWLGTEDGTGDLIEIEVVLESSTLENAIDNLLPSGGSIIKGTITEPVGQTYQGTHQWETPLDAIRTVVASLGCEFKVNPDGTLDAGPKNNVFNVDVPTVVVTRMAGKDPEFLSADSQSMVLSLDASAYVSRGIVVTADSDNVKTLVGYSDRIPAPIQYDIHGNLVSRTLMAETFGSPVSVATYLLSQLNDHATVAEINIGTEFDDMSEGSFAVGDGFWAYDPPAFVDTGNEITFRGAIINPKLLRLLSASFPIREGMGVYYRTPEVVPAYHDLTRYIIWEGPASEGRVSL
jgi:hypothetical protein